MHCNIVLYEIFGQRVMHSLCNVPNPLGCITRYLNLLQILELLWNLAHLQQLSREMVELALDSHYHILIDSFHMKDHERRIYINKCVEDIKKV